MDFTIYVRCVNVNTYDSSDEGAVYFKMPFEPHFETLRVGMFGNHPIGRST